VTLKPINAVPHFVVCFVLVAVYIPPDVRSKAGNEDKIVNYVSDLVDAIKCKYNKPGIV